MNKKWAVKRITINLASTESEKLEKYCASTGRPASDVIRELIRSLSITELSASEQTTPTLKYNGEQCDFVRFGQKQAIAKNYI